MGLTERIGLTVMASNLVREVPSCRSQWPAARCKAGTVFACSNTGIVGSNPIQGMDVCVRLFCVCAVLCAGGGLATG
jgi:hypothetical protein